MVSSVSKFTSTNFLDKTRSVKQGQSSQNLCFYCMKLLIVSVLWKIEATKGVDSMSADSVIMPRLWYKLRNNNGALSFHCFDLFTLTQIEGQI